MAPYQYEQLSDHYQALITDIMQRYWDSPYDTNIADMTDFLRQSTINNSNSIINPRVFEDPSYQVPTTELNLFFALADENRRKKYMVGGIDFVEQPAFLLVQNIVDGKIVAATNKFLLTAMQENRTERFQILETFGAPSIMFYDEKTKVYSFAGILLDAIRTEPIIKIGKSFENVIMAEDEPYSYLWGQSFRQLWDSELRGTKLVENRNQCVLALMNNILIGYPVVLSITSSAGSPATVNFQFSFICLRHVVLDTQARNLYDPKTYAVLNEENRKKMQQDLQKGFNQKTGDLQDILDQYYNIRTYGGLIDEQLSEICRTYFGPAIADWMGFTAGWGDAIPSSTISDTLPQT